MKFRWSPFGSTEVFELKNPELVKDDNYSVISIYPFFNNLEGPIYVSGEIEKTTDLVVNENLISSKLVYSEKAMAVYRSNLEKAIKECNSKQFTKLVVSRKVEIEGYIDFDRLFHELVDSYSNCFVYQFELNGYVLIGATPEKLLSIKDKFCKSASLAGTMNSDTGLKIENWGEKEKYEQKVVTDYLVSAYSKKCFDVKTSNLGVKHNGSICHLLTEVSGLLKPDVSESDLLELLHPTPAVCGIPKEKALKWISNNEDYDREYYAGFIGIKHQNSTDYYVNLRCLKSSNNITTLYAGGGITENSVVELEENETEQKLKVLLKAIEKFHTFVE